MVVLVLIVGNGWLVVFVLVDVGTGKMTCDRSPGIG